MNEFVNRLKLKHPLVVAPMAGGPTTVDMVVASSNAGALGSIGGAYSTGALIEDFAKNVREKTSGPMAINLFIPHNILPVSADKIAKAVKATENYRKELNLPTPDLQPPYEENFDQQFESVLKVKPEVLSFVFGLLAANYVKAAKKENIYLIGTATTFEEAQALEETGVDAVTLQGVEAGGHRGIFDSKVDDPQVGAFELLEQCKNKIKIPLIAAGGIMSAQDIKQALQKGAQAVQMGTAFLTCKESGVSAPYKKALLASDKRKTRLTRAFSGRFARGIENRFMLEMQDQADSILPFPAQNKFTRDLRNASAKSGSADFLSLWSGSGNGTLWTGSTEELITKLFGDL